MAFSDFVIKEGDQLPAIEATLTDGDGQPVNLAGAAVTFSMRMVDADVHKISAAAAPDADQNANPGLVRYVWQAGDTDTPGVYRAEWVATFTGKPESFPNSTYQVVKITAKLA